MKNQVSIFYVNSMGFMCQWKGVVLEKTETKITIQFSKKKAFRYNLKESEFCLVTKKLVKDLGVCISKSKEAVSFQNEKLIKKIIDNTKDNVEMLWQNDKWEI